MKKRRKTRAQRRIANISIIATMIIVVLIACVLVIFDSKKSENENPTTTKLSNKEPSTEESTTELPKIDDKNSVTILAVGDNLMHDSVNNTAKQQDGSYNYDFLFTSIKSYLDNADISIINQETILGGNSLGIIGYPAFNSPTEVGDAIVNAGFDVVLQASNHSDDKGLNGMTNCINYWNTKTSITMLGIHEKTDENTINVIEKNGIKVAILNYTYGTNASGNTFPTDLEGKINMLCAYNKTTRAVDSDTINPEVISDIKRAEAMADVVVVCPHWGTEYTFNPTAQEKNFAKLMTEAGADIIIGTHPHVIQPVEWVTADNGNKALCFYSLGNYASTQDTAAPMLGGMAKIVLNKTATGVEVDSALTGVIPLVTHYTYNGNATERINRTLTGIYLLSDYNEELAAKHGIIEYYKVAFSYSQLVTWSNTVLGTWKIDK